MQRMNRMFAFAVFALAAFVSSPTSPAAELTATPKTTLTTATLKTRISGIQALVQTLDQQLALQPPRGLAADEQVQWKDHGAWLASVRKRYAQYATAAEGNFGDTAGLSGDDMVKRMAEMNLQFLQLQEAVQNESRRFQTLSNASKARHDIAMSSIRNIK